MCFSDKGIPDWVATEMVWVSTVAFLGTGTVMEALEERVGLTLLERPFSSFLTSSSSVPARSQAQKNNVKQIQHGQKSVEQIIWSLSIFLSLQLCHVDDAVIQPEEMQRSVLAVVHYQQQGQHLAAAKLLLSTVLPQAGGSAANRDSYVPW